MRRPSPSRRPTVTRTFAAAFIAAAFSIAGPRVTAGAAALSLREPIDAEHGVLRFSSTAVERSDRSGTMARCPARDGGSAP